MADELYLEPNRKARIVVVITFVFLAVIVALIDPTIKRMMPGEGAPVEEVQSAARFLTRLALGIVVLAFIISLVWVAYFCRLGYRTLKLGSYPPVGAIVLVRTRVRTGKQAVLAGYLSISLAVLLVLLDVLVGYVTWFLTSAL
jgi:hypothetical protein